MVPPPARTPPRTRPLYWSIRTPDGAHRGRAVATAVATPHLLDQWIRRVMERDAPFASHARELEREVWAQLRPHLYDWFTAAREHTTHWVPFRHYQRATGRTTRWYVYLRRRYNARRHQHELELITLTPTDHALTEWLRFARRL